MSVQRLRIRCQRSILLLLNHRVSSWRKREERIGGEVTYDKQAGDRGNSDEESAEDAEEYAAAGDDEIFDRGTEPKSRGKNGVDGRKNDNEDEEVGE